MRILLGDLRSSDLGGALVEFAVAVPLLALLAIAAADYARVYKASITVANAARTGAQFGGHTVGDTVAMRVAAEADAFPMVLDVVTAGRYCTCPDLTTPDCSTGNCPGYGDESPIAYDTVRAVKAVPLIFRYPGIPTTITVARTVVFRSQ